jgi:hypothetical protein
VQVGVTADLRRTVGLQAAGALAHLSSLDGGAAAVAGNPAALTHLAALLACRQEDVGAATPSCFYYVLNQYHTSNVTCFTFNLISDNHTLHTYTIYVPPRLPLVLKARRANMVTSYPSLHF